MACASLADHALTRHTHVLVLFYKNPLVTIYYYVCGAHARRAEISPVLAVDIADCHGCLCAPVANALQTSIILV